MKPLIMNSIRLILIFVLFFSVPRIYAQGYTSIEDVDILEQQREVLKQNYEHEIDELEVLGGYRIDEIHTMIAYKKDGIYHEAVLNSERKEMMLVSIAAEIPVEDLPDVVMNAFRDSEYADKEILKSFRVYTPYGEDFIRIDVEDKDETKKIYFNELGVIQKDPY
ncbi:MAG: hypothetical protein ACOCZL_06130 [Bacteroidota bacterium]